jgi:hypothetical protein
MPQLRAAPAKRSQVVRRRPVDATATESRNVATTSGTVVWRMSLTTVTVRPDPGASVRNAAYAAAPSAMAAAIHLVRLEYRRTGRSSSIEVRI